MKSVKLLRKPFFTEHLRAAVSVTSISTKKVKKDNQWKQMFEKLKHLTKHLEVELISLSAALGFTDNKT